MPTTTNKGYEVQVTGTNTDTWGDVLNEDVIEIIDRNIGGIVSKTLSNVNVILTAEESQNLIVRLTGVLTGAVLVTTAAIGMTIIENLTTGSFAVTFGNSVGSPVEIDQGTRAVVITDATNAPRIAADSAPEFASGTRMVFQQTAAPTGWTKESSATYNDAALRFVTGSIGTGGTVGFTTAFTSQALSGTVGNTTLTIDQIPPHTHTYTETRFGGTISASGSTFGTFSGTATGSAGGGQAHNHSLSINNLDIAVKYVGCIIAQKA